MTPCFGITHNSLIDKDGEVMNREEKFIQFFGNLTKDNLSQIDDIFTSDAHFKDPFNNVTGIQSIKTVFEHMFATTDNPVFVVNHYASKEQKLFIQWKFTFSKDGKPWEIDGASMITFDDNDEDKVKEHIDYWDPAEQIYTKIGLLRPMMNFLRSRLTAS